MQYVTLLKYIRPETDFNTNTIWQPIPLHLNDLIYNNLSLMTHRRKQWLEDGEDSIEAIFIISYYIQMNWFWMIKYNIILIGNICNSQFEVTIGTEWKWGKKMTATYHVAGRVTWSPSPILKLGLGTRTKKRELLSTRATTWLGWEELKALVLLLFPFPWVFSWASLTTYWEIFPNLLCNEECILSLTTRVASVVAK